MSLKKKFSQYGVLIVGLMIGGGFAFGGIASYAGLVDTGSRNTNNQDFNTTLPDNYFQMEPFDLTRQEQRVLAYRNDVVFVNAFYTTSEEKQRLSGLEGVEQDFNGRMYFHAVNYSDTVLFQTYGFTEFPKAVVVGATRSGAVMAVNNVTRTTVSASTCEGLRTWGTLATQCESVQVN